MIDKTRVFNEDCLAAMRLMPDKCFDLAIVDPPYGIGAHKRIGMNKGKVADWIGGNWDKNVPNEGYFEHLFRVSENQIIWGGNYFTLPPSRCILIWDKIQRIDMADCELAWTSFNTSARIFQYHNSKLIGFQNPNRFHPTEKPIQLYKWLLKNYAKEGDKILDTHLGSGSSRIAAYDMGFDFTGYELDTEYFQAQEKRFKQHTAQLQLFAA